MGAEGALGSLWVPVGPLGSPWVPLVPLDPFGFPWVPLGPLVGTLGSLGPAPVSRNDKIASREFGGGAGIAGAWKRVGGHARSVESRECMLVPRVHFGDHFQSSGVHLVPKGYTNGAIVRQKSEKRHLKNRYKSICRKRTNNERKRLLNLC